MNNMTRRLGNQERPNGRVARHKVSAQNGYSLRSGRNGSEAMRTASSLGQQKNGQSTGVGWRD